jgi:hypothetical protein
MRMRGKAVAHEPSSKDHAVTIIACTKQKRRGTWPAIQLYDVSALFRECVKVAKSDGLPVLILSTKYGLVEPEAQLAWYEQPLETMTPELRKSWDATVSRQLSELKAKMRFDRVLLLASREYRQAIAPLLASASLPRRVHPQWTAITERTLGKAS